MPVDLREIASIAGMPGLYRIVGPTRSGVIIESLTENPARSAAQAKHRISLLHEISIYTNDPDVTVPLADVFQNIKTKYGNDLPVSNKFSNQELTAFMEEILPDYDRDRVYMSDIKKIAAWYNIVSRHLPFTEAQPEAAAAETSQTEAAAEATEKEKPAKKTKAKTEVQNATEEAEPQKEAKPKKTKKSAE